uniref:CD99 antigen-like isoform X1 n=1 Tax=Castor canadensis TaxID=51338 RepID=A0A8B7W2D0_CASCN|nr:CD99 antigen-like isoform X1 [Castor canadensis]
MRNAGVQAGGRGRLNRHQDLREKCLQPPDGGFDLSDALGDDNDKKPTDIPKKPSDGDPAPPRPRPQPDPRQPGSAGGFSDSDLVDGTAGGQGDGHGGGGRSPRNEDQDATPQGVIPGIIGAVVVAVAGAISSFIAYQKKKFCFKESAEDGDIQMENHANAEPPVQQTLLEK